MKAGPFFSLLMLMLLLLVLGPELSAGVDHSLSSESPSGSLGHDAKDTGLSDRSSARFFLPYVYTSTITSFSVSSVTSTRPFTCIKARTTTACTGRRRRRRRRQASPSISLAEQPVISVQPPELSGSVVERETRAEKSHAAGAPGDSRLILTSWVTVVSSYTSISTVTTYGTTVSVNLLCSIGGTGYAPLCGSDTR